MWRLISNKSHPPPPPPPNTLSDSHPPSIPSRPYSKHIVSRLIVGDLQYLGCSRHFRHFVTLEPFCQSDRFRDHHERKPCTRHHQRSPWRHHRHYDATVWIAAHVTVRIDARIAARCHRKRLPSRHHHRHRFWASLQKARYNVLSLVAKHAYKWSSTLLFTDQLCSRTQLHVCVHFERIRTSSCAFWFVFLNASIYLFFLICFNPQTAMFGSSRLPYTMLCHHHSTQNFIFNSDIELSVFLISCVYMSVR